MRTSHPRTDADRDSFAGSSIPLDDDVPVVIVGRRCALTPVMTIIGPRAPAVPCLAQSLKAESYVYSYAAHTSPDQWDGILGRIWLLGFGMQRSSTPLTVPRHTSRKGSLIGRGS